MYSKAHECDYDWVLSCCRFRWAIGKESCLSSTTAQNNTAQKEALLYIFVKLAEKHFASVGETRVKLEFDKMEF